MFTVVFSVSSEEIFNQSPTFLVTLVKLPIFSKNFLSGSDENDTQKWGNNSKPGAIWRNVPLKGRITTYLDSTNWIACQFSKLLLCNELPPHCHIWDQLQIKVSFNMCAIFHSFQEDTFLFELWLLLMKKVGENQWYLEGKTGRGNLLKWKIRCYWQLRCWDTGIRFRVFRKETCGIYEEHRKTHFC